MEPSIVVGRHDRRRTLTDPAFVARVEELSALEAELDNARQGRGGLALLEAQSGVGKTRLLDELARSGTRLDARVLRGQGLDQTAQRPFEVLSSVARDLLLAAESEPALATMLRRQLGDRARAVSDSLPELATLLGSGADQALGPESFGEVRSLEALTALLDALASTERMTLVLLDDCQWADEMTFKLLDHWQRHPDMSKEGEGSSGPGSGGRLLVVAAFRSEEASDRSLLQTLQPRTHVTLSPFRADEVRLLAESMAGALPEEVLEVVERLSGGSPFLATAVLRGLVESGALIADTSGWRSEPLVSPDTITARNSGSSAKRVGKKPRLMGENPFLSRVFWVLFGAKNLA